MQQDHAVSRDKSCYCCFPHEAFTFALHVRRVSVPHMRVLCVLLLLALSTLVPERHNGANLSPVPRACYEVASVTSLFVMRMAKAMKCMPLSVLGSLS